MSSTNPLARLYRGKHRNRRAALGLAGVATAAVATIVATTSGSAGAYDPPDNSANTTTPIKHVVVIYQENVSYDHYFATYPNAANTDGTQFLAYPNTPANDNLQTAGLLAPNNPNSVQPFRLTPGQAVTCDQNHGYKPEQLAENNGAADQYVENTNVDGSNPSKCAAPLYGATGLVMGYYDGNTVTGLWNYAQNYAMSDSSYSTGFGPSTPGALNLVAGQTGGFRAVKADGSTRTTDSYTVPLPDSRGVGTIINDPDPAYDDCNNSNHATSYAVAASAQGRNVGDLLNIKGVTWGWFQGGFAPTTPYDPSTGAAAVCGSTHTNVIGGSSTDYNPHHNPFAYYATTSNPHHIAPKNISEIGHSGQANHNYDLSYFGKAIAAGNLPAVSFVKAANYQDGHAGYSDPIDEQHFLVNTINTIEKSQYWKDTAIVVAYDDSDGWYDHKVSPILSGSNTSFDSPYCSAAALPSTGQTLRCGPGPRQPLLVISPYSRWNYISHTPTEQTSILKFIEQNWSTGFVGGGSFDARAGRLNDMFNFKQQTSPQLILKSDGSIYTVTGPQAATVKAQQAKMAATPQK